MVVSDSGSVRKDEFTEVSKGGAVFFFYIYILKALQEIGRHSAQAASSSRKKKDTFIENVLFIFKRRKLKTLLG